MVNTAGIIIGLFVLFVMIILQFYLTKQKSKWAGFILPLLTFGFSIVMVIIVILFSATVETTIIHQDDFLIIERWELVHNTTSILTSALIEFLLYNIPTAILLLVYTISRRKYNKQLELERMSVLDL